MNEELHLIEKNNKDLLSVIMSVYCVDDDYLVEAIDSILNQTYDNFEFLIFDDATNASNKKVLQEYASKDDRIKLYVNDSNKGLTYNLNRGIELAKGKYICRQDADDISMLERFSLQYKYMEENKNVALLGTNRLCLEGEKLKKDKLIKLGSQKVRTKLLFENCITHSSVMIRKDVLSKYNLNYDLNVLKAQDYNLWIRIADIGDIDILQDRLCVYRIHSQQITRVGESRRQQKQFFIDSALTQLDRIGVAYNGKEREAHVRFLLLDVSELSDTFKWCLKLMKVSLDSPKYNKVYFNMYVINRMFLMLVKKIYYTLLRRAH